MPTRGANSNKWGGNGSAYYSNNQYAGMVFGGDGTGASSANGFTTDTGAQNIR